jgi:hypothetical protein
MRAVTVAPKNPFCKYLYVGVFMPTFFFAFDLQRGAKKSKAHGA